MRSSKRRGGQKRKGKGGSSHSLPPAAEPPSGGCGASPGGGADAARQGKRRGPRGRGGSSLRAVGERGRSSKGRGPTPCGTAKTEGPFVRRRQHLCEESRHCFSTDRVSLCLALYHGDSPQLLPRDQLRIGGAGCVWRGCQWGTRSCGGVAYWDLVNLRA